MSPVHTPWLISAGIAILATAGSSLAQPTTRPATTQATNDEQIRAALRKLIPLYEQSISTEDIDPDKDNLDSLKPYLAPEFSGVMMTSREVHSFDELRQFWKDMKSNYIGKGGKYRVKVNHEPSLVIGNDVVVAKGTADEFVQSDRGNEFRYTSEWTAVFRRNPAPEADPANQWRIVRLHASMDPVFNQFVDLRISLSRWITIAVTAVICLAIGFIVAWFLRRPKPPVAVP